MGNTGCTKTPRLTLFTSITGESGSTHALGQHPSHGLGIAPLNRGEFRDADSDNFAKVAPEDNEVMVGAGWVSG
jgi:hypothetical protein